MCASGSTGFEDIGFEQARQLTLKNVVPMEGNIVSIDEAVGKTAAEPVYAKVDSPSVDASLKDGYAVIAAETAGASVDRPVEFPVSGNISAGDKNVQTIAPNTAVRILSGGQIPPGADAVIAEEYTRREDNRLFVMAEESPGRNILYRGTDVAREELLAGEGQVILPQSVSLLTAGGISEINVYRSPRVGLLATGSELMLPHEPFTEGKIYASNVALQQGWLRTAGLTVSCKISPDSEKDIAEGIQELMVDNDVVITSGGAWKSDRDLVTRVLSSLGWRMLYHRVRMGPGKAVGMGVMNQKPVFCLPGGPASNQTAFLMLVFPAILKMAGNSNGPCLYLRGRLDKAVAGQADWTQFIQCDLMKTDTEIILHPRKLKSRLAAMAKTPAVVKIPEGVDFIPENTIVPFVCMDPHFFTLPLSGY